MDLERIIERIEELELLEKNMNDYVSIKRIELASKEAEVSELRKLINENNFMNTAEYKELQELRIAKRWLEK